MTNSSISPVFGLKVILRNLGINLLIVILFTPLFYVFSAEQHILGYIIGGLISCFNFSLLILVGLRIFMKKSIAQTIGLIVIKYAVLGVFIYKGMRILKFSEIGIILGISTLIPSLIVYVINPPKMEVEK